MARKPKPLPPLEWLEPRIRVTRWLSLLSYIAVMLLLLGTTLAEQLPAKQTWSLLAFQLVPLLILLPGVVLASPRGHAWACFVINLYFIQGVVAAFQPTRLWFGLTETALTVIFFCAATLFIRYSFQHSRRLNGEQ